MGWDFDIGSFLYPISFHVLKPSPKPIWYSRSKCSTVELCRCEDGLQAGKSTHIGMGRKPEG